jgi:hypothetical protein
MPELTTFTGGCHCGAVRYCVQLERLEAVDCNCSICQKKGFLHVIVPASRFAPLIRVLPNTIFVATAGFTRFIDRDRIQTDTISIFAAWMIIRSIASRSTLLMVPIGKHRSIGFRDGIHERRTAIKHQRFQVKI